MNYYEWTNSIPINGFIHQPKARPPGGPDAPTGASASYFAGIAQGTNRNARVGNVIYVTGLRLRVGLFFSNVLGATQKTSSDTIRFILYLDKQTNGTAMLINDILDEGGTGIDTALTNTTIRSSYAMNNIIGCKILKDFKVHINAGVLPYVQNTNGAGTPTGLLEPVITTKNIEIKVRFRRPLRVIYTGTAGAVAELFQNNIGMLSITDWGKIACFVNSRVYFKDD